VTGASWTGPDLHGAPIGEGTPETAGAPDDAGAAIASAALIAEAPGGTQRPRIANRVSEHAEERSARAHLTTPKQPAWVEPCWYLPRRRVQPSHRKMARTTDNVATRVAGAHRGEERTPRIGNRGRGRS
jgi:hypothetical protein